MHKKGTNLIVGVVIIVSLAILIFGVRFLSETKFRETTYTISALFENVGTLTEGDPVKINGVKKGKVLTIELKDNKVEVVMAINNEVKIPRNSRIVIQNIGLMGERMIGVQLGEGEPLAPGAVMQGEFDSGIAEAMGMLGDVLKQVQSIVGELQGIVRTTVGADSFKVTFKAIMQRLDSTTAVMNQLVAQNKEQLQGSIDDLSATAGNVRSFMDKNKDKLDHTVTNVSDISDQAKELLTRADKITKDLEALVAKLNSDNSSVGRMLNDTAFVSDLKTTISNADTLVRQIRKKGIKVGFW